MKPLLNDCLLESENLHETGTKSWISGIHNILSLFDASYTGILPKKLNISNIKQKIKKEFEKFWTMKITNKKFTNHGGNKLRTYSKFKSHFTTENYVNQIKFSKRVGFTKFRISAHSLAIETGRHTRPVTPVENRLCRNCASGEIEDEVHVLIRCTQYTDKRQEVFETVGDICKNFNILSDENKLLYLLNSEDDTLMICVDFINHIIDTRRSS
ncbi:hypothetical protein FSP39_024531 [Pinctada imbricata]|uniref:Uncharacterized protein n=1 Tax=Pinctada imbricata TaxID=66713 RepID=A0AA88YWP1_PINIB|nr:hypothetical protein FSP39_024531 [Pinctada imbricata]